MAVPTQNGSEIRSVMRVQQLRDRTVVAIVALLLGACGGEPSESSGSNTAPSSESSPSLEESASSVLPPPGEEGPPPPPSSAFIALLTPEQTAELRVLGSPLVVPTDIPTGFLVERAEVIQDERAAGYQILYRDSSDRCFAVEHTVAGIGSTPETEYRIPIQPPLVGEGEYGLNYGSYVASDLQAQFPEPTLMSDWLPKDNGYYRLAGATYINERLAPSRPCQDITPEEAVQIVESLALITDEITGDG